MAHDGGRPRGRREAAPPANTGKLLDKCAWCERVITVHDRAWEHQTTEAGLVAAAGYCGPLPGDPRDEDWTDENGMRNKGLQRSGCERLGRASPDVVVRRLRTRQATIAAADAGEV